MKIKQYRNLFENWQRHVHEEETVSQEPEKVIEIPAPPPVQNPQMDDEEMDRIMAEVVEGRKVVKEQPLLQEKADPNIPKDAVLGYVCEEVLGKVIDGKGKVPRLKLPTIAPKERPEDCPYRKAVANMFTSPQIKNTIIGMNKKKTKYKNTIEYVNNLIVFHNAAIEPTQDAMGYQIDVCPVGDLAPKNVGEEEQYETTIRNLVGNTLKDASAGGTATYDVETDRANLHVKLNQDKVGQRLIGFQRGLKNFKAKVPKLRQQSGTLMNRAWSNFLKKHFAKGKEGYNEIVKFIDEEMKEQEFNVGRAGAVTDEEMEIIKEIIINNTITAEGVISKPSGYGSDNKDLTYVLSPGEDQGVRIGKRRSEQEGETLITLPYGSAVGWWAVVKNKYKELIKEYMKTDARFNKNKYKLLKYVLDDIKTKLIGQPGSDYGDKVTLFFNYRGGMKKGEEGYEADVELDVNKYRLKGCGEDEANIGLHFLGLDVDEKRQPFGLVYSHPPKGKPKSDNSENILFTIEFRTDGEGHPPQLKIGKGLKAAKQDDSDLYKWYRKAAKPEKAK